jgi:hypothetical protein
MVIVYLVIQFIFTLFIRLFPVTLFEAPRLAPRLVFLKVDGLYFENVSSLHALSSKSNLLVKRVLFLLNAAFAMTILDLISRVHLASLVIMLTK